jgi:6-phospho-3-hexuloisomerase
MAVKSRGKKVANPHIKKTVLSIIDHIKDIAKGINELEIDSLVDNILSAERIFLHGTGRSGLVARTFATRLMQLGLTAYVVGESTTPAMTSKDLLICVSGSGQTSSVVMGARLAKKVHAKVLAVTSYPKSCLGCVADYVVTVKGKTKIDTEKNPITSQILGSYSSLTPLGTLFEDTTLIFFEGVVSNLMSRMNEDEGDLKKRHCSIE